MKDRGRVAVIGAGLGGLAAALKLAHEGLTVDVYERLKAPGGKASQYTEGGYRFDMGPSLLTLKGVFEDLIRSVGERPEELFRFERLDPITRYFFPDGTVLNAFADRERFADEVQDKLGEDREKVLQYLERCRRTYEASESVFLNKPLHEASTIFSTDTIKSIFKFSVKDAFRTMHRVNSEWFSDKRTIQLFDRYATYNGSSPYLTPATFNLIQHVEYGMGGFSVKGGIHRIPKVLESIASDKGASFHYDQEVERIVTSPGKIEGIRVSGDFRRYDAVVSNSDVTYTYQNLLKDGNSSSARKYNRLEPSSSGQVFFWGVKGEFKELIANNIFFSEDYRKEFDDIWGNRKAPGDPTVYINITSKSDREDAPQGSENWFVLVNVPYDSGQNWKREEEMVKEAILKRIEGRLGSVRDLIEVEGTLGPQEIERKYGGNKGSIYGISSNNRASAFLRQPNRSREYRGLYFAGGSAHPGGGMPLVVLSGINAADCLLRNIAQKVSK